MYYVTRRVIGGMALASILAVSVSFAQQPPPVRVRGTVEGADGPVLTVKTREGAAVKVKLTDNVAVRGIIKASLADIKDNSFIGVTGIPQADGSQKAVEVHIFAESQRGTGDGHRDGWPGAPNGTMTNGEAGNPVTGVDGLTLMVKYKGGEKKLLVTPATPIVQYQVSDASALKPGAAISINAAIKKPDGSFETNRINVGLNGVVPN
jgi:hypothetical protein